MRNWSLLIFRFSLVVKLFLFSDSSGASEAEKFFLVESGGDSPQWPCDFRASKDNALLWGVRLIELIILQGTLFFNNLISILFREYRDHFESLETLKEIFSLHYNQKFVRELFERVSSSDHALSIYTWFLCLLLCFVLLRRPSFSRGFNFYWRCRVDWTKPLLCRHRYKNIPNR